MIDKTRITSRLVSDNNLFVDTSTDRIGIGTENPTEKLSVVGNIQSTGTVSASRLNATGISTVQNLTGTNLSYSGISTLTNLQSSTASISNLTGTAATFTDLNASSLVVSEFTTSIGGFVGDLNSSGVSTIATLSGTSLSYENGNITSLSGTDLNYSGISTLTTIDVDHAEIENLETQTISNAGIVTSGSLNILSGFDVYANSSVFHENVIIQGNLTVNGTEVILNVDEKYIKDKQIILGFSTTNNVDDITANGGGIAIASTEGNPLVCLQCTGINTLPSTYKQLIWTSANTFGAGTTDAFLFNYAVGIGSTLVPNNVRLAVGGVQITDDTVNTSFIVGTAATFTNLNVENLVGTSGSFSGIVTAFSFVGDASGLTNVGFSSESDYSATSGIATYAESAGISTDVIGGIASVTSLSVSGVSTLGTIEISSGIITATSGVVTYYGDGSNLTGVTGFNLVVEEIQTTPVYLTFVENIGVSSIGISTEKLSFIPSTGSLGIGTTNPTSQLQVDGDVLVSGIVTATAFDGEVATATNVIGGIASVSYVSVSSSIFDSTNSSGVSQYVLTSTPSGILWQSVTAPGVGAISGVNVATSSDDSSFIIPFFNIGAGTTANAFVAPSELTYNPFTNSVGIGTTNPIAKLDVRGTGNFIGTSYQFYGNTGFGTQGIVFPFLYFGIEPDFYEGTELFKIQQPNPFDLSSLFEILTITGIGTTANSRLDYYGTLTVSEDVSIGNSASIRDSLTTPNILLNRDSYSTTPIQLSGTNIIDDSAVFHNIGSGIVGLSTNSERYNNFTVNRSGFGTPLDLTGSSIFSPLLYLNEREFYVDSDEVLLDAVKLNFYNNTETKIKTERVFVSTSSTFFPFVFDNDFSSSYFTLNSPTIGIGSTGNLTTSVTFEPVIDVKINGNIGIGTTNPAAKLEILGNLKVTSMGANSLSNIEVTHQSSGGVNTSSPSRGAVFYEGVLEQNLNGGQLVSVINDNTNIFTVNRFVGLRSDTFAPAGQRNVETVFNINSQGIVELPSVTSVGATVGAATTQVIDFRNIIRSSLVPDAPVRGSVVFGGTLEQSNNNGGQLFTILNDNTNIFTINTFVGLSSENFAPAGQKNIRTLLNIPSSGNIGIGTTRPLQLIQVGETNSTGVSTDGNVTVVTSVGRVGIGTTNPITKLDVRGDVNISGVSTVGLGSTSSPTNNSTFSFELTDNTTLTVRVRGTDGVVRTGIISLS